MSGVHGSDAGREGFAAGLPLRGHVCSAHSSRVFRWGCAPLHARNILGTFGASSRGLCLICASVASCSRVRWRHTDRGLSDKRGTTALLESRLRQSGLGSGRYRTRVFSLRHKSWTRLCCYPLGAQQQVRSNLRGMNLVEGGCGRPCARPVYTVFQLLARGCGLRQYAPNSPLCKSIHVNELSTVFCGCPQMGLLHGALMRRKFVQRYMLRRLPI
jgi:hypothetical protein